jgi:hypothetical protein
MSHPLYNGTKCGSSSRAIQSNPPLAYLLLRTYMDKMTIHQTIVNLFIILPHCLHTQPAVDQTCEEAHILRVSEKSRRIFIVYKVHKVLQY